MLVLTEPDRATAMRFRSSLPSPRTAFTLGVLTLVAAGWGECGGLANSAAMNKGSGGWSVTTATAGSDSGGTVIHNGEAGSQTGGQSAAQALCGEGCTPDPTTNEACSLEPVPNSGAGGAGGAASPDSGTCQLTVLAGKPHGTCGVPGAASDGAPCLSVQDCAAGLACVQPGVCRPYCCSDAEACAPKSFCAPTVMTVNSLQPNADAPKIPVCTPTEPCTLLDDATCSIPGDTCTLVRADGTTSCLPPGVGSDGESCPCAAGFVCSTGENRCFRLCHTTVAEDCPSGYQCSGGSKPYPTGFGVCVML